jgi:hypothetical protein
MQVGSRLLMSQSMFSSFYDIYKKEGFKGLYRVSFSVFTGAVICNFNFSIRCYKRLLLVYCTVITSIFFLLLT